MDIQKLALSVFENKEDYANQDYIVIMNLLMEAYHKHKGTTQFYEVSEKDLEEDSDSEEYPAEVSYTDYDSEAEEYSGYLGSYIESY